MPIKQYENHDKVEKKYKWDLSFLLEGKTPEEAIAEYIALARKQIAIKESKYESKENFMASLKLEDELGLKGNKIGNFLSNSQSLNVSDPKIQELMEKFSFEDYKVSQELGATTALFYKNSDKIAKWAKEPEFKEYKHALEAALEGKKHILPDEIEAFRVKEARADISAAEVFSILTNTELDYGYAETTDGEKIKLNASMQREIAMHSDPKVRKTGIESFNKAYIDHKGTLASLIYQHFKRITTWADISKYESPIHYLTFDDRVTPDFLETLYKATEDNMDVFQRLHDLHSKFYETKFGTKMTKYDRKVELLDLKTDYSVDEAIDLVKAAMKPFGKEYNEVLNQGFESNWVDFMPIKNKRSGAYSIGGTYGLDKKLILMNYDGTLESVSTLAHEFGHSMHSYFSDKSNNQTNSSYKIFVAEIASIFNELMLYDHVLETSDNDELKFKIIFDSLKGFDATVRRQIIFSKYEYDLYNEISKGKPYSSYTALAKLFHDSTKAYTVTTPKKYNEEDYSASISVPHFYYGFYVYKYAVGQLVANIFFAKYKKEGPEALQSYINDFLSAGGRDFPLNILKGAGVDLNDPKVYKEGFDFAREKLDQLEELGNKIFKK